MLCEQLFNTTSFVPQRRAEAEVLVSPSPIRPNEDTISWGGSTVGDEKEEAARFVDGDGHLDATLQLPNKAEHHLGILKSTEKIQEHVCLVLKNYLLILLTFGH